MPQVAVKPIAKFMNIRLLFFFNTNIIKIYFFKTLSFVRVLDKIFFKHFKAIVVIIIFFIIYIIDSDIQIIIKYYFNNI